MIPEEAVVIEDFADTEGFDLRQTAANVSATLEKDTDNIKTGDRSGKVSVCQCRRGAYRRLGAYRAHAGTAPEY